VPVRDQPAPEVDFVVRVGCASFSWCMLLLMLACPSVGVLCVVCSGQAVVKHKHAASCREV
jgi:hypothetical protein